MFSADHKETYNPYWVLSRLRKLNRLAREPFHFAPDLDPQFEVYGLGFPDLILKSDVPPDLKWVNWRWPRYEFDTGAFENLEKLKMTTQWMVHDNVVLQRCLLENCGTSNMTIDLQVSKQVCIRTLDHLKDDDKYFHPFHGGFWESRHSGPKGYSWTYVQRIHDSPPEASQSGDGVAASRGQEQGHPTDGIEPQSNAEGEISPDQARPYGIAIIMSVNVDGSMRLFQNPDASQTYTEPIKGGESRKVTMVYKMVVLRGPENKWQDLVITAAKMKLDSFLESETPSCFLPLSTTLTNDGAEVKRGSEEPAIPFWTTGKCFTRNQAAERAAELIATPRGVPNKKSAKQHIEFMVWRHSEHILSVCVIPITATLPTTGDSDPPSDTQDNIQPVAITCGGMAGHRICTSAS